MATPAEVLAYNHGVVQPAILGQSITQGELAGILNRAAQQAQSLVGQNLLRAGVTGQVTAAQMQAATQGLGALSSSLWGKVGAQTRAGIHNAANLAVEQQLDRDYLIGMPFKAIQDYSEALFFNAFQSAEDIISRRMHGFTLADRIYRNGKATVMQVGKIIEQGLALQQSARQIAAQVRGHFDPNVRGGTSYAAMRLARTEINNAHHDTTVRLTKPAPWVLGYRWNLSSSHPRPDPCDAYAGDDHSNMGPGVFAKGDVPPKPHPQCLCYLSMVQPDRKQFTNSLANGEYDNYLKRQGVSC